MFGEMFGVVLVQYSIFKDPSILCSLVDIIIVFTISGDVATIRPVTPRSTGYLWGGKKKEKSSLGDNIELN
jgi:hypothetical protein